MSVTIGIYVLALFMSLVFTHMTLLVPGFLESQTDVYWDFFRNFKVVGMSLTPVLVAGNVVIILLLAATVRGMVKGRSTVSFLGAFGFFVPTFFVFIVGMTTFFAGLEVIKFLIYNGIGEYAVIKWVDRLYNVGNVFYIPYWLAISAYGDEVGSRWGNLPEVRDTYGGIFIAVGLLLLFLGVAAWLDSKYRGRGLVDSGVYRWSRHPQYLGYILWSYGVLVLSTYSQAPMSRPVAPSLNWAVSSLIVVGLALSEEIALRKDVELDYIEYVKRVSFMIPLPKLVREYASAPFRIIWRSDYPDSLWKVFKTLLILFLIIGIPEFVMRGTYGNWYQILLHLFV